MSGLTLFRPGFHVVAGQLRATSTLFYPTIASMYLEVAFALGLWLLFEPSERRPRLARAASFVALLVIGAGISATFTRAGLVGMFACLLLVGVFRVSRLSYAKAQLGTLMALAVALVAIVGLSHSPELLATRLRTEGSDAWYGARYQVPSTLRLETGRTHTVPVGLANTGRLTWDSQREPVFSMSYHWLRSSSDAVVQFEGDRTPFPRPVSPGESITLPVQVTAPGEPGNYTLAWDIAHETRAWLSTEGVASPTTAVQVVGARSAAVVTRMDRLPVATIRPSRPVLWNAALKMASRTSVVGFWPRWLSARLWTLCRVRAVGHARARQQHVSRSDDGRGAAGPGCTAVAGVRRRARSAAALPSRPSRATHAGPGDLGGLGHGRRAWPRGFISQLHHHVSDVCDGCRSRIFACVSQRRFAVWSCRSWRHLMRIAFDGTTLTPGGRVSATTPSTCCSTSRIEVEKTGDELVVVSNQPIDTAKPLPRHVRVHDRSCFPAPHRVDADAGRHACSTTLRADVAHFTNGMMPLGTGGRAVVTIHDMSLRLFPRCHPLRRLVINRPLLARCRQGRRCRRHGVAQRARDLLRFHGVPARRVSRRPRSGRAGFRADRGSSAARPHSRALRAARRFVLYVGAIEPRKNLPRLMDAFALARSPRDRRTSSCASARTAGRRAISISTSIGSGLGRVVHFTGYVPVEDLPAIYNLGEFFVFPSLYEGFGLPVVEAMACGTPVITANTSSLAEIAAGAAETVDPHDTEALAAAIVAVASDRGRQRTIFGSAACRARREFSWARTAQRDAGDLRAGRGGRVPRAQCPPPRDWSRWRWRSNPCRARRCHDAASRLGPRSGDAGVRSAGARLRRAGGRRDLPPSQAPHAPGLRAPISARSARARDRLRHRARHGVSRVARRHVRGLRSVGRDGEPHAAAPGQRRARRSRDRPAVRPAGPRARFSTRWPSRTASTASSPTSARSTASSTSPRSARWRGATSGRRDRACSA